ncbi:MAG: alpha/beta hydrolase fold protein [Cyanobacteria bacterium RYN_339]|nr:alpha/beta hydrolase fold protein [Cyanobacteria bacterium RYN_339]
MAFDTKQYQDLYPFEGKTLDVGGARMHYLDEGQGPPVLMLHGNPSWSFYYRDLAQALRGTHRVIVPDHVGCGLSDKPGDDAYDYTLKRRVDDLDRLMDHLALTEPVTLVVHDWGGMIGMTWASRHPERIARLVVLNTAAFFLPTSKAFPLALRVCRDSALGALLVRGANAFSVAASFVGCKRNPMDARLREAYQAPYDSWDSRIATLRFVQDIPLDPQDKAYAVVDEVQAGLERFRGVPMLICWGEQDFVFDKHFLAEWERRFPDALVRRFPDAGHYILEDAGAEVIPAIKQFMGIAG